MIRPASRPCRHLGFTLIEVLVALFIVALGIGALLSTLTSAASTIDHLRDKSFAEWVALNRVSEARLSAPPATAGSSSGQVEFAGRTWYWRQQVTDKGNFGFRQVDVTVSRVEGSDAPALASAIGFVGLTMGAPSPFDPDWSLESLPASNPGDPEKKR